MLRLSGFLGWRIYESRRQMYGCKAEDCDPEEIVSAATTAVLITIE